MKGMKKIAIAALAAGISLCTGFGAASLTASAESLADHADGIKMNVGASVRYIDAATESSSVNPEDNGLRFELLISDAAYTAIKTIGESNATFGVLIAPAEYEKTAPLTQEYVFGDKKAYDWATWSEEKQQYEYTETDNDNDGESDYTRIINVSTTVDFTNTNLKTTTIQETVDGTETSVTYYHYYGSITGIREENLAREFIGVGYVQAGADTQFAVRNDNVRSIAYVAQMAIADTASDAPSPTAKTWLETNYVTPVLDEETTYTVEYRVGDNVTTDGTAVLYQKQITAKIGDSIDTSALSIDGLTVDTTTSNSATVFANGKTAVVADCTMSDSAEYTIQALGENTGYLWKANRVYYITDESKATAEATSYNAINVVFANQTQETVTVNVSGSYGSVAVFDGNGVVVEGRDGGNGKLVNAANPVRATSSAKVTPASFANAISIPAGAYAIVIQYSISASTDFLTNGERVTESQEGDLRNTLNNAFIGTIGARVQLAFANKALTEYQAGAYVKASYIDTKIKYNEAMAKTDAFKNIVVYDDKGTFDKSDDTVKTVDLAITDDTNLLTAGTYTVAMQATDNGGETINFYRGIKINDTITVTVGSNIFTTTSSEIVVNTQVQSKDEFKAAFFRLYTSAYTKDTASLYCANEYGASMIISADGVVLKSFGATGPYYTDNSGTSAGSLSTATNANDAYMDWVNNYKAQGCYFLIAPNDGIGLSNTNETDNARYFLNSLASTAVGQKVTISYYDF